MIGTLQEEGPGTARGAPGLEQSRQQAALGLLRGTDHRMTRTESSREWELVVGGRWAWQLGKGSWWAGAE